MANPYQTALTQTFEGFDQNRAQDPKKSAKDAFLDLSKKAPTAPTEDKAALGGWFNQYIAPGMNELGHGAQQAQGDKFRFKNWQGEYDVDFGRGAGAPGGALAWQAEDVNAPSPVLGQQPNRIGPAMPGQGSDLMTQILEALQAQQGPVDPQALLLEQLR